MATLVTCQDISKSFALRELFSGLSLSFADEERVGFIGPNGSGKTTLFNSIVGYHPIDSGSIKFEGQEISKMLVP